MLCYSARKRISSLIDGELKPGEAKQLEAHLAGCPNCAAIFDEMAGARSLFAGFERFPAPHGFSTRVMAAIQGQPEVGTRWNPVFARFAGAAALALAIAAGIFSGGILTGALGPIHYPTKETVVASLSLDVFEASPPGSLGKAYLASTKENR